MSLSAYRFPAGLYGITPEWSDTPRLLEAIQAAHAGGMQVLQYRRKQAQPQALQAQLEAVLALCQSLSLPLLINDHWEWAQRYAVQGAHLGKEDGLLAHARASLGHQMLLGGSCYNSLALAQQAVAAGADYVAFGAVYPSTVKPDAPRAELDTLRAARRWSDTLENRPRIVAIGGITPDNAAAVIEAGAHSLAIISALFEAKDVYQQARRFAQLFPPEN